MIVGFCSPFCWEETRAVGNLPRCLACLRNFICRDLSLLEAVDLREVPFGQVSGIRSTAEGLPQVARSPHQWPGTGGLKKLWKFVSGGGQQGDEGNAVALKAVLSRDPLGRT